MSASLTTPGARRAQAIRVALEDLALALADLREVRPQINDPDLLGRLDAFISAARAMLEEHEEEHGSSLPAQARSLRDGISEMAIPSRDPELGRTETLRRLQSAEGLFTARLDRLRNLLPETPTTSETQPRAETGAVGERIEERLQSLEASLQALRDADRGQPGLVQQTALINLYIKEAKTEISLARFLSKIGETNLDLGTIQAAAQRLARLTGDFLAMVAGWAGRISEWLPPLGERLRRGAAGLLKAVALGWKVVGWRRERQAAPDPKEVRRRLLAGEAIPPAWVPGIKEVDLSNTDFTATERLAGLANLQNLDLTGTQVSDITPLAGLANLQNLSLTGTQVSDITPLATLANLQGLSLTGIRISDIAPLADLAKLYNLDIGRTAVSDIAPLATLANLMFLDLRGTLVSAIAPLAALANLLSLDLGDTWVSDIAPLAALANLQTLYLGGTQVSDIAPLAALANLQSLDLAETQVSDITPLAAVQNLRVLLISSAKLAGYTELGRLKELTILFGRTRR